MVDFLHIRLLEEPMRHRDEVEEWDRLPAEVLRALDAWLDGTLFELTHRGWFTAGRTGAPVGLVLCYEKDVDIRQLVLKFCDRDGVTKARAYRKAYTRSPKVFRQRHLVEMAHDAVRLGEWWLILQQVAGGDLLTFRPLTELMDKDADFPQYCETVVGSILRDWNEGRAERPESLTVKTFLERIMGSRIAPQGPIYTRAQELGVTEEDRWMQSSYATRARPNPLLLLTDEQLGATAVEFVLVGNAHGDLNGRNIAVPVRPVRAADYLLIDTDRFDTQEPLLRDPMHLLVALAIDLLSERDLPIAARCELVEVIVDPQVSVKYSAAREFGRISAAIHSASREYAAAAGLGDLWSTQNLLALIAAALMHVGRDLPTRDPDADRRWCLELAATATEKYLDAIRAVDPYRPKRNQVDATIVPGSVPPKPGDALIFQRESTIADAAPSRIDVAQPTARFGKKYRVPLVIFGLLLVVIVVGVTVAKLGLRQQDAAHACVADTGMTGARTGMLHANTVFTISAEETGQGPFLPGRAASVGLASVRPTGVQWCPRLTGDAPALYGGIPHQSVGGSDVITYFQSDAQAASAAVEAFSSDATVQLARNVQLTATNLDDFIRTMTPVVLTVDTEVMYHRYKDGRIESDLSILQAGTAVLVDIRGVPRFRMRSGTPLTIPEQFDADQVTYSGSGWPSFDAHTAVTVRPSGSTLPLLRLRDLDDPDRVIDRPVGTNGERDSGRPSAQSGGDQDLSGNWIVRTTTHEWVGAITRAEGGFQFVSYDFRDDGGQRSFECQLVVVPGETSTLRCVSSSTTPGGSYRADLAFDGVMHWDERGGKFRFTGAPRPESGVQERVSFGPE
ncbi:DUF6777 domain-containing protein [Nocardia sp. NPDC006044]|uniref:DUF6777 domain-containing protein n=1 Tax=Nocardia sp. NPDC006044 TaxID=3364306 RepID=UPI0036B35AE9